MDDGDTHREPVRQPLENDSRLSSFLRQASAIIAIEKGLTPACQIKLESLAEKIKLPADLFEIAMEQLKTASLANAQLTRYEKAFVDFLSQEFAKLKGGVLPPKAENAARELAADRYQINLARAEQLIEAQCRADDVSRIAPDEVITFARQTILQQLGDTNFLDDSLKAKLYAIGARWGLNELAVDQIALARLHENQKQQKDAQGGRKQALLITLVVAMLLALAGFGWTQLDFTNPVLENNEIVAPANLPSEVAELPYAPRLRELIEASFERRRFTPDVSAKQAIMEPSSPEHQAAIGAWFGSLLNESPQHSDTPELTYLLLENKTNQGRAGELLDPLVKSLNLSWEDPASPPTVAELRAQYRVHRLVHRLEPFRNSTTSPDGYLLLRQQLPPWCAIELETNPSAWDRQLALHQWNQLLALTFRDARPAVALIEPLEELTRDVMMPERMHRLKQEIAFQILKKDLSQAKRLERVIRTLLAECDSYERVRWAELARNNRLESAATQLAELIADSIPNVEKSPTPWQAVDTLVAEHRYRQLKPVVERIDVLESRSKPLLNSTANQLATDQLPERIAELSACINLELQLLVALNNRRWDTEFSTSFDRQIELSRKRLRDLVVLPVDPQRDDTSSKPEMQASASDTRMKNTAIDNLQDVSESTARKLSTLKQLSRVAKRIRKLSYPEAKSMAQFFFSDLTLDEQLELQKTVGRFSHWPQLAIAVADQLEVSKVELDWAATISRLLLHRDLDLEQSFDETGWRVDLQRQILAVVYDELAVRISRTPESPSNQWFRVSVRQEQLVRQRLALLGAQPVNDIVSLVQLNRRCNEVIVNRFADRSLSQIFVFPGQSGLSVNPLDQLTLDNLLTVNRLSKNHADEVQQDVSIDLERVMHSCENVGQRFFASQQWLLKSLQRLRRQIIDERMKS